MPFPKAKTDYLESVLPELIEKQLLTQKQAADQLGVSLSWVERACKRLSLQTQRSGPRSGPGHPNWQGGRMKNKGYWHVWMPDHPNSHSTGYVAEHRLVMSQHLGRALLPEEVVHHIDGNRENNELSNLAVFQTNADHLRFELSGQVPNWTDQGLQRMEAGIERSYNSRTGRISDASQRNQRIARLKEIRGNNLSSVSESD